MTCFVFRVELLTFHSDLQSSRASRLKLESGDDAAMAVRWWSGFEGFLPIFSLSSVLKFCVINLKLGAYLVRTRNVKWISGKLVLIDLRGAKMTFWTG